MEEEKKKVSPDKDKETKAPEGGDSGEGDHKVDSDAPSHKFKSWEEAEKAHIELEKKMRQQSDEVGEARKLSQQYKSWGEMLSQNPELYKQNVSALNAYLGKPDETKKKGEAAKEDPRLADLRQSRVEEVLQSHYSRYGYNSLEGEERKKALTKLATQLADLLDPTNSRPLNQIINDTSVTHLPKYLEKAQTLIDAEKSRQEGQLHGILAAEENRAASIGSMAASSGKAEGGVPLTSAQKEVAQKMGISEEDYAKSLKQIKKEEEKYSV